MRKRKLAHMNAKKLHAAMQEGTMKHGLPQIYLLVMAHGNSMDFQD